MKWTLDCLSGVGEAFSGGFHKWNAVVYSAKEPTLNETERPAFRLQFPISSLRTSPMYSTWLFLMELAVWNVINSSWKCMPLVVRGVTRMLHEILFYRGVCKADLVCFVFVFLRVCTLVWCLCHCHIRSKMTISPKKESILPSPAKQVSEKWEVGSDVFSLWWNVPPTLMDFLMHFHSLQCRACQECTLTTVMSLKTTHLKKKLQSAVCSCTPLEAPFCSVPF